MGKLFFLTIILIVLLTFTGVLGMSTKNIKDARRHAEEMLLPVEGIVGISHREDPPRIIVYIEHEKYRSKVPTKIDGFDVEVKVTGRIKALSLIQLESKYTYSSTVSRTGEVRPMVGGISIGIPETDFGGKMAGTLGIVVESKDGQAYILTNAHVIAMNSKASFLPLGTAVLQPGTYDGGSIKNKVGELYSYIRITFGPKKMNYADAAIAKITISNSEYLIGAVLDYDDKTTYRIKGIVEVSTGNIVRKSGRTTGVTYGEVLDTDATVKVWYTTSKWAIFYDQILVSQPFIEAGDSGSVVDKDGSFVGLAFAGSSSVAVVCKARYVVDGLKIEI